MEKDNYRKVRVFFSKLGFAKYISHLDLHNTFTRAIRRGGLDVWYTEGFNPRAYLTFALPLSLGIESVRESMEIRAEKTQSFEYITEKLSAAMPDFIKIFDAAEPVFKHTEITKSKYELAGADFDMFGEFLEQDTIKVIKKTKKGEVEIDLKPMIEWENECITLPSGTDLNINPQLVISSFEKFSGVKQRVSVKRICIYCGNGEEFR